MTLSEQSISAQYPILAYFAVGHLPAAQQAVSRPFMDLAQLMAGTLPRGPETAAGLRKLLEAKDCMVRASLGSRS